MAEGASRHSNRRSSTSGDMYASRMMGPTNWVETFSALAISWIVAASPVSSFRRHDHALPSARRIDVLLAGGGAPSPWYQGAFKTLDLRQWAIDPLRPQVIPKPADWRDDTYPRFVVANGLSNRGLLIRYKWTLPDDNKPVDEPPAWRPPFDPLTL